MLVAFKAIEIVSNLSFSYRRGETRLEVARLGRHETRLGDHLAAYHASPDVAYARFVVIRDPCTFLALM